MKRLTKIAGFFIIIVLCNQHCIAQIITTFAGNGIPGYSGDGGPATIANLSLSGGGACDRYGNYYLIERYANRIRIVNTAGIINTVAGNGIGGYSGDGGAATSAQLNNPTGIAVDAIGNIYIADFFNHRVRMVDTSGIIHTIAGNGIDSSGGDGSLAISTALLPSSVCLDGLGNIYVTDTNARIRKIDTYGIITTIAGNGIQGYSGDGGPATAAEIEGDRICTDANGNLYIACIGTIRKVDAITGIISTIAGNGDQVYNGDGMHADSAQIYPRWITFDNYGNLYIADYGNQRIRQIDNTGIIHTVAGNGINGFSGDGGPADSAEIYDPEGVVADSCGNLYIADKANYRVRKVTINAGNSLPAITISSSVGDTICAGTLTTFTTVTNSSTFAYKWLLNGVVVSMAGSTYTYAPANGDSINCIFTGISQCSAYTVSSNTIYMIVPPAPAITITASAPDTICTGTSVTYTATVTGASAPVYQWLVNGSAAGTGSAYTYTPANGDSISCVLADTNQCNGAADTVSSNGIHTVVLPAPSINITANTPDTVCTGTPITFTATIAGANTATYKWLVNGSAAGTGSTHTYTPANGDSVRCILTGTSQCSNSADTVSSNTLHLTVAPMPSITITASTPDTVCSGTPITFTATVTGDNAPAYEWLVNNNNTGTNSTYTYTPNNGDSVRCVLAASVCPATGSNTIHLTVDTFIVPTITITGTTTAAVGNIVTLNAAITDAGSSYNIHWYNNGVLFNTTTIPTVTYTKAAGTDDITATVIPASAGCYDSTTSTSHTVTVKNEGINNVSAQRISIYPNPAHTAIIITATEQIQNVTIINLLGQTVYNQQYNSEKVQVSMENLPVGIYFVKVNGVWVQKVVKE